MNKSSQQQKAEMFRRMHDRSKILVLPNAWDAASARIFEAAGFRAVATTSAGVSNMAGYPDGEVIPRSDMVTITRWIARALEVPVTADIESGFGATPEEVGETVRMIIDAGAVGINLEDSLRGAQRELRTTADAVERIRAARSASERAGVPIVINARTDVFLLGIGEKMERFDNAVKRLNSYREAGADCLYPMGIFDAETIARLTNSVNGPVNVMGWPGAPSAAELERLGVARVSTASGPARFAMSAAKTAAEHLARTGSFDIFGGGTMTHQEANALMAQRVGNR